MSCDCHESFWCLACFARNDGFYFLQRLHSRIAVPSSSAFSMCLLPVQESLYFPYGSSTRSIVSVRDKQICLKCYIYYDTSATDDHQLPSLPIKSILHNARKTQVTVYDKMILIGKRFYTRWQNSWNTCQEKRTKNPSSRDEMVQGRYFSRSKTSSSRTLDRIVKHEVGAPARCMYNSCSGRTGGLCCDWHCAMLQHTASFTTRSHCASPFRALAALSSHWAES